MRLKSIYVLFLPLLIASACNSGSEKEVADLILVAKHIHLGNGATVEAIAIKEGLVLATGSADSLQSIYQAKQTKVFADMNVYPGFNDAHAHFLGYARGLGRVNLIGTKSWQECLDRLKAFADANPSEFILGRGWDQNDWEEKVFPTKAALDSMYPNTPVLLSRIDGHAAIANQAALELSGITGETKVKGGLVYTVNGEPTGVLIDNAVDLVEEPQNSLERDRELVLKAQEFCLRAGLTSITDAGLKRGDIEMLQALSEEGALKLRLNVMVSDDSLSLDYFLNAPVIEGPRFRVKTVKFYLDGALGSRGALLLDDYSDDTGNLGLQLKSNSYFMMMADSLAHLGWQMAIHAIGDSANRLATELFGIGYMHNQNHRWRIEHAQIVHPDDLEHMAQIKLIPSIQPTHATSDMYWAEERLGAERISYAYPAKSFLEAGLIVPLGTDFPVEDINPLYTMRAAQFRQDEAGYPPGGFRPDEALSFEETLRGMTWSGAYASFEEEVKGLLLPGYYADFVVFREDLESVGVTEIGGLEVQATAIHGELLYGL